MILDYKNEKFECINKMTFIVDTMLGKLSRWLRILGYDTIYDPDLTIKQLAEESEKHNAIFLTRRKRLPENLIFRNLIFIPHDRFEDQIKFIVNKFGLSLKDQIFTRCIICNSKVSQVSKEEVSSIVPERTYAGISTFFKCPQCKNIYWIGTHYRNTIEKLKRIFQTENLSLKGTNNGI